MEMPGSSDDQGVTPESIKVEIADELAVVTLNRPGQRNAMTYAMWQAMPGVVDALDRDKTIRTIILTGAGGNFCAGADITEFATTRNDVAQVTDYEIAMDACCDALSRSGKPSIAVIKGYCLGGGAHLAMSCDFRYCSTDAQFGIPAARLSTVYGVSATRKLLALVGIANARKILFGGQHFAASEAHRIGFVDHVAAADWPAGDGDESPARGTAGRAGAVSAEPMTAARAFAKLLAQNAPLSIAGAKAIINGLALEQGGVDYARAEALIAAAAASADYREGREAFAEKREPRFKGR